MKKVVLALAVVFSVALVSCSNDNKKAEDTVANDTNIEAVAEDTNAAEEVKDSAATEEAPAADTNKAEEAPAQ